MIDKIWNTIIELPTGAAAFFGALVGSIVTALFNLLLQFLKQWHENKTYLKENLAKENAKRILLKQLNHKLYTDIRFSVLQNKVRIKDEDIVRNLLLEIGAIPSSKRDTGEEIWYLEKRVKERNEKLNEKLKKKS